VCGITLAVILQDEAPFGEHINAPKQKEPPNV